MASKTFLYYEVEVSQELRDENPLEDNAASIMKRQRQLYLENNPNDKHAKIIDEFIYACTAFYDFKEGTNTGAIVLEFLNERDYERRKIAVAGLKDHFASIGLNIESNVVVRHLDQDKMLVPGPNDSPNLYWHTKVYFNETLPKEKGFSTICLLEEADGEMSWIDHWTRPL
jgi:hypothetical protein